MASFTHKLNKASCYGKPINLNAQDQSLHKFMPIFAKTERKVNRTWLPAEQMR
jgi:hypothetical protein